MHLSVTAPVQRQQLQHWRAPSGFLSYAVIHWVYGYYWVYGYSAVSSRPPRPCPLLQSSYKT